LKVPLRALEIGRRKKALVWREPFSDSKRGGGGLWGNVSGRQDAEKKGRFSLQKDLSIRRGGEARGRKELGVERARIPKGNHFYHSRGGRQKRGEKLCLGPVSGKWLLRGAACVFSGIPLVRRYMREGGGFGAGRREIG